MRIPIESSTSYRGRNSRPNLPALLLFVVLALGAGAVAYRFSPFGSREAAHWYDMLAKADWLPPRNWLVPVWGTIYVLMAVAAWIVWRERYHRNRTTAIIAYGVQLLLNALWAPLFFGLRNIGLGLFEIVALWVAVGWTLREFVRVRFAAGLMIVPYFLWMTACVAMAFSLWKLNP
ncbi:MAG TPA: TspO/MBR family protein [Steroidobacteraceae bacterium]